MGICYGTLPVDAGVYIMSKLRIKHSVRTTIIGISLCGLVTKHDARRRITWTIMLISIDISFCFWYKHTINNSRFGEYEWNNYNIYHFLPIIEIIERWKWFIVIASRSCFHVYPSCWIASIDCHFTYVWFVFIRYTRSRDKQLWSRRNIMKSSFSNFSFILMFNFQDFKAGVFLSFRL